MISIDNKDKGFTLVEMMVSISIASLVMLSIVYIINTSTKNYRNVSAEVSLQTEAQIVLNQISDMIIKAYNVKYLPSGELTIYQEESKAVITHDVLNKKLGLVLYDSDDNVLINDYLSDRYIESFQVIDTGTDNSNNQIKLSITLKNGRYSYEIKEQIVTLRNQIKLP